MQATHTKQRTLGELEAAVGGLSKPSKMPGYAYGIPADECKVGSLLRKVKGSTCSGCYAMKGRYAFQNVKAAQYRRLDIMMSDLDAWTENMIELLGRRYPKGMPARDRVFRWHDSGDLQSIEHLDAIVKIARALPRIAFWLPTREFKLVHKYEKAFGLNVKNLVIRVSATMVGEPITGRWTHTSGVDDPTGFQCPAPSRGGKCLNCRACWSKSVAHVSYHKH